MENHVIIHALLQLEGVNRKTIKKALQKINFNNDLLQVYDSIKFVQGSKLNYFTYDMFENLLNKSIVTLRSINNQGISVTSIIDEDFPKRFSIINDSPVLIYYIGSLDVFNSKPNVAIIGTREPTSHGIKAAERLAIQFVEKNCNIVSGLAIGCDTFAHEGCLKANGKTLAVLPGGVDKVYPSSNRDLAKRIVDTGGALISEYPVGSRPFPGNYVDRDRLQSAFSESVVVVETGIKGGTMHTVSYSKIQNKILACYDHSEKYRLETKVLGNRKLIQDGLAIPISSEADINSIVDLCRQNFTKIDDDFISKKNTPSVPEDVSYQQYKINL